MLSIYFTKNTESQACTNVYAEVDTGLSIKKPILCFNWSCDSQYSAELLVRHLRKELSETLKQIRKNAYEKGLKDGRSKKTRLTIFSSDFYANIVGW